MNKPPKHPKVIYCFEDGELYTDETLEDAGLDDSKRVVILYYPTEWANISMETRKKITDRDPLP